MFSRRTLLAATLFLSTPLVASGAAEDRQAALARRLAELERAYGGRLGVAILDTANGRSIGHRLGERFPMCSTFKALVAACVLARVDRGAERLARRIDYPKTKVLPYSPVTAAHADADGLTVGELCAAAVILSDNTAANLLLDSFGGPAGLTAFLRGTGDEVTRLDRCEPKLNEATPDDPRDTTTPAAIAETLRRLVIGTALSSASRMQLAAWLVACRTGGARLRAGIPRDWRVGDKTGTGGHNATNDVAILWSPGRAPLVVAAYYVGAVATDEARNAILAEVGRAAAKV